MFLDGSTTCLAIARHLLHANITVVTNSLDIAQIFSESGRGKVLLSGGELDRKNRCFAGGSAEEFLAHYYVDKSFVSCRGADRLAGITDGSAVSGRIRAMMLRRAGKRCLVLDHTKLDQTNFFQICDFDAIHVGWQTHFQRRNGGSFSTNGALRWLRRCPRDRRQYEDGYRTAAD